MRALSKCRPNGKPSNNDLWKSTLAWLEKAIEAGIRAGWADNAHILLDPIPPENLEALRIAGDTLGGLGSMPTRILHKIQDAGLFWYT